MATAICRRLPWPGSAAPHRAIIRSLYFCSLRPVRICISIPQGLAAIYIRRGCIPVPLIPTNEGYLFVPNRSRVFGRDTWPVLMNRTYLSLDSFQPLSAEILCSGNIEHSFTYFLDRQWGVGDVVGATGYHFGTAGIIVRWIQRRFL